MLERSIEAGVGRLTLDRPEVRNALSSELMAALDASLVEWAADPKVRVVVFTGRGNVFCAGADLRSMKSRKDEGEDANRLDAREMGGLFHRIASFPKPTVAAVNGAAIGGGVGLLAACDLVLAVETARFQFSEVRLGLVPAVISPFCIRRLGAVRARRLFLTGERFDAASALAWGLVDRLAAPDALEAACEALLDDLRAAGPEALIAAKELVATVEKLEEGEAVLDYTSKLIARLRASDEAQQGMQAFLSKTAPPWAEASAGGAAGKRGGDR
jgi:methylglutaconyl-CoA hydratase